MPTPDELASEEYQALVKKADEALQRRAAVISGHRMGPRIVWSLQPMSEHTVRALISAEGLSPLVAHEVLTLPRVALLWAGAPHWAQYAYLVNVETKATFSDSQR
jgi:hypothetical protein